MGYKRQHQFRSSSGSSGSSSRRQPTSKSRVVTLAAAAFALAGSAIILSPATSGDNLRHSRSLSVALLGGGCKITPPKPPRHVIESSFIASYPGSGAKMTWNLVEGLTGLVTGDEHGLNGHSIGKAVTIKTHFPHEHGNPSIGEITPAQIPRAILLLRHPKDAIPGFHNFLWEQIQNLPGHSTRAPLEAWEHWRDVNFEEQMAGWAQHADYWLSKYEPDNRLILGFEGLTDDTGGPASTNSLAYFLSQSEGVDVIEREAVPCIWEKIVKYKGGDGKGKTKDGVDGVAIESKRAGSKDKRTYTEEQLNMMLKMILALMKKYKGDRQLMPWLRSYKTITEGDIRRLKLAEEEASTSTTTTMKNEQEGQQEDQAVAAAPQVSETPLTATKRLLEVDQLQANVGAMDHFQQTQGGLRLDVDDVGALKVELAQLQEAGGSPQGSDRNLKEVREEEVGELDALRAQIAQLQEMPSRERQVMEAQEMPSRERQTMEVHSAPAADEVVANEADFEAMKAKVLRKMSNERHLEEVHGHDEMMNGADPRTADKQLVFQDVSSSGDRQLTKEAEIPTIKDELSEIDALKARLAQLQVAAP